MSALSQWNSVFFLSYIIISIQDYNCSMFCCKLLYVYSSFAIILMGKRELVALLSLSSWCLVIVVWLFLAVPWVCLQFVIVVFPDHTHNFCLTVAIVTHDLLLLFVTGYIHTRYDPDKMSKSLNNTISIQGLFNCSYCHSWSIVVICDRLPPYPVWSRQDVKVSKEYNLYPRLV